MKTYLEIVKTVLERAGEPMTPKEIWDYATIMGYGDMIEINGKTPENTILAQLDSEINENKADSIFMQVAPNTFGLKVNHSNIVGNSILHDFGVAGDIAAMVGEIESSLYLTYFLDLLKLLTEFTGLPSADPRLVCCRTKHKLQVYVNSILTLSLDLKHEALAISLYADDEEKAVKLKGYIKTEKSQSENGNMSAVLVDFDKVNTDYAEWIDLWKKVVFRELETTKSSPFRTYHDDSLYRLATDLQFRKELLGIVETDDDTQDIQEGYEQLEPIYDPLKTSLDIQEDKFSVFEFMRKYDRKQLVIDPDYQRNRVWKIEQMSRFIESIMLNFPLQPMYLNQRTDGNFVIIDGLQRTTALHLYMKDEFALRNLKTLTQLNGKRFSELPEALQTRIEDKNLIMYILKPSTPISVIYELFDRINTGGTPLNRQEVRNCIFIGKATVMLKELARSGAFVKAIDKGIDPKRMKDQEAILRYLAFRVLDYESNYQGDLSSFVEQAMRKLNQMTDAEIERLKADFLRAMQWAHDILGNIAFRIPIFDTEGNLKFKGFINMSVLESVAHFFYKHSDDFLSKHQHKIAENYRKLITNPDYLNAVKNATGNKTKVRLRFQLAEQLLSQV